MSQDAVFTKIGITKKARSWSEIPLFIIVGSILLSSLAGIQPGPSEENSGIPDNIEFSPMEIEDIKSSVSLQRGWFTENNGQIGNSEVQYFFSGQTFSIGFMQSGYLLTLSNEENVTTTVRVSFGGSNTVVPEGGKELANRNNYFYGNDSSTWTTDVSNYAEVVYENLYDGINLIFYFQENVLKYDFQVLPGANPGDICSVYEGAESIVVDSSGNLQIISPSGTIKEEAPYCYQIVDGKEIEIGARYDVDRENVTFLIGDYNPNVPLIIDPIIFSTFIGGTDYDSGEDMVVDADGNIFITGSTQSTDFPTIDGGIDNSLNGDFDIFISKMNSDGTDLLFSTFVGSDDGDSGSAIKLDDKNNIYIVGSTNSPDFPVTTYCYDNSYNGESDIVAMKFAPDCNRILYSTFIGGSDNDWGWDLEIDDEGNVFVAGTGVSSDFPTTPGCYDETFNGVEDLYAIKLNLNQSELVYSTYVGGSEFDGAFGAQISVDAEGAVYLTGFTDSIDYPTTLGSYDQTLNGANDAFITKLNADGSDLEYSTYIGGSSYEDCMDIALDSEKNAYIHGHTGSVDFPTTFAAYDNTLNGNADLFVTVLNNDGSNLIYSTYIGGASDDIGKGIILDIENNAYITGNTRSEDFPTTPGCFDDSLNDDYDAYICKLNPTGSTLLYSSYIGGDESDVGNEIRIDKENLGIIVGITRSINFPTSPFCYDDSHAGSQDIFLLKINSTAQNIPPTVYIKSPKNHSDVTGHITIKGTAWDPNNVETIVKIELSIDSADWIIINGTSPWDYAWNTTRENDGPHTLRIRAYDGNGYSKIVILQVNVDNNKDESSPLPLFPVAGIVGVGVVGLIGLAYKREDFRFFFHSLMSAPLYSKVSKKDILNQTNRDNIYSYICINPGVNLSKLQIELEIGYGTLVHHLTTLERENLIRSEKTMGLKLFHPKGNGSAETEKENNIPMSEIQRDIYYFIKERELVSRTDIEDGLGINKNTLGYQLRRMKKLGLIQPIGMSRAIKYRIISEGNGDENDREE